MKVVQQGIGTFAAGFKMAVVWALALSAPATLAQVPGMSAKAPVGAVVSTPQVRAELLAHAPEGLQVGQTVWLGLQLTHQPQWHTYWKNSGDSGMPTELAWQLPKGLTAGEIAWPTPKKIPIGPLANYGYEGTVLLPVPVKVSSDFRPQSLAHEVAIRLHASWLVCKLECIPEQGEFEIKLPLRGAVALSGPLFEATWAASPKPYKLDANSSLSVQGRALQWQLAGLPSDWRGKPLLLFPETPEITSPAAPLEQSWHEGIWQARAPMARHRSSDPVQLPVVLSLADGSRAIQVSLPVQGAWPPKDAPAEPTTPGAGAKGLAAGGSPAPLNEGAVWGTALGLALLGALIGGLLLNLMPCVFPILAIKALQLAQAQQTPATQRAAGIAYAFGVVLSTLALGTLMLALRAAGQGVGWGFQLQSPGVVMALAALFVLIALNLLGALEVGQWAPARLVEAQVQHPTVSALLAGVLAVAVASPCSAPFMGAAMGMTLTMPAWQALLVFAALGLGLALPFLVLGFMPALAARLPKPGAWMETFKHLLAFPMLATTVWLVWVLGQQNGIDAAGALLMLLVILALAAWVFNRWRSARQQGALQTYHHVAFAFASLLLAVAAGALMPVVLRPGAGPPSSLASTSTSLDRQNTAPIWQEWTPERQAQALAEDQSVFVDYTAAWCVTCQFNKQTTLDRPETLAAFQAKKVLLLRADWTRPNPLIAQSIAQLRRSAVPVYVLLTPGKPPNVLPELLSPALVLSQLERLP